MVRRNGLDPQSRPLPGAKSIESEDWFDPLIGLKGMTAFGKSKFFVSGGFALGGFGVGSDLFWDASINLGYQWTKGFSTTLGYRYLDVDYENNGLLYNASQDGLTLGLSWRFLKAVESLTDNHQAASE